MMLLGQKMVNIAFWDYSSQDSTASTATVVLAMGFWELHSPHKQLFPISPLHIYSHTCGHMKCRLQTSRYIPFRTKKLVCYCYYCFWIYSPPTTSQAFGKCPDKFDSDREFSPKTGNHKSLKKIGNHVTWLESSTSPSFWIIPEL